MFQPLDHHKVQQLALNTGTYKISCTWLSIAPHVFRPRQGTAECSVPQQQHTSLAVSVSVLSVVGSVLCIDMPVSGHSRHACAVQLDHLQATCDRKRKGQLLGNQAAINAKS